MKRIATTLITSVLVLGCGDDGGDGGGTGTDGATDAGSGGDGDSDASGGSTETGGEDPLVARGRYIVNDVAMCSFCHTPRLSDGAPDLSMFLAGNPCFDDTAPDDDEMGCISTRNLTNHETGLANATDEEVKQALTEGIGVDGRNLVPVMPYWVFHNMTDEDLDAIVAYLRTIPGVDNMTPPSQAPWTEPEATLPPLDPAVIPSPAEDYPERESAERGRYLSTMASLCVDCHTPEMTPFGFDFDFTKIMGGGRGFPAETFGFPVPPFPEFIYTSNLTTHSTGIEGWTKEDIVKVMKEGVRPDGMGVCAPTHGGPSSPFAGLTDQDVEDIANYLLSIPPVDNMIPEDCEAPPPS